MLDVSERQLILDRFLARERREKMIAERKERIDAGKAEKSDVRWLINMHSVDIDKKLELIRLLKINGDWQRFLFRNGYLYPMAFDSVVDDSLLKERKLAVTSRYSSWKSLRHYLRSKGIAEDVSLFPAFRLSIYQFLYDDNGAGLVVFLMMLINYIPLYNLYMYDPVPGANFAYRYYTGEPIIVYQFNKKLADDRHYRMRIRRAVTATTANGYDLRHVYKLVLCDFDWKPLDDQRGTGAFKLFVLNPNLEEFHKNCLFYWKNYSENEPFFKKFNVFDYVKSERVLPWPYMIKDGKLLILHCIENLLPYVPVL